jgi:ATP phosphoribosyltransferase
VSDDIGILVYIIMKNDDGGMSMKYITIALAKGRLADLSIEIFESIGLNCSEMKEKSRKLIFTDEEKKVKFILVKASDVPTYVEYGAADIGIVGKDTLLEEGRNLYEMVNLKFGACKMVVAGPQELKDELDNLNNKRVATKYPHIARDYFQIKKGQTIEIIKLNGSVELAPLVGLSEVIVDIVESGKTLHENGLIVFEEICDISARLVVNRVSMKMEKERIMEIVKKVKEKI